MRGAWYLHQLQPRGHRRARGASGGDIRAPHRRAVREQDRLPHAEVRGPRAHLLHEPEGRRRQREHQRHSHRERPQLRGPRHAHREHKLRPAREQALHRALQGLQRLRREHSAPFKHAGRRRHRAALRRPRARTAQHRDPYLRELHHPHPGGHSRRPQPCHPQAHTRRHNRDDLRARQDSPRHRQRRHAPLRRGGEVLQHGGKARQ